MGGEERIRIGLFAAREVGHAVARFLAERAEPPLCLVLDEAEGEAAREQIICAAGVDRSDVFLSSDLQRTETIAAFRERHLDLILLSWWPYILREPLISLPRLGCLNFHPSLLPYNRGKHYNFWAIVENAPFGVTLHWVDVGVDSGDIAYQSSIPVSWEDTGETLYHRAHKAIIELFMDKYAEIRLGHIPRVPQDLSKGSFHLAAELDSASQVELHRPYTARDLLNLLRARTFPPYPAAWFIEGGKRYEVRVQITCVSDENEKL